MPIIYNTDTARTVLRANSVAAYEPGAFYRREVPCLEAALNALSFEPEILVVDGYVWLGQGKRGLGAYLYEARRLVSAVVGIAKTAFFGADQVEEVIRGQSLRPLFVSAVGMDLAEACARVREMHGNFRIPWAVSEVDRLARSHDFAD